MHLALDLSHRRRVLVAGDVHGEYGRLQEALDAELFDPALDSLVLVGDLADRGPDSMAALDWLARPWVHRVLGNHDIAPRLVLDEQIGRHEFRQWGGGWCMDLPDDEIERIAALLEDAPVAMTVTTPGGRMVGIAHADCLRDWREQVAMLAPTSPKRGWARELCLWSRETIRDILARIAEGIPVHDGWARVANIDHVFHGHTILDAPLTVANRSWIDTGAYRGGPLTVVDIDKWIDARTGRTADADTPDGAGCVSA